jgi:hypothetical protein
MIASKVLPCLAIMQNPVEVLKLGKPTLAELEHDEKQDFRIDLTKGTYTIYLDGEPTKGKLNATLQVLKMNGAEIPNISGKNIDFVDESGVYRHANTYTFATNMAVRLRLKNNAEDDAKYWVTYVPSKQAGFIPFAFGAEIKEVAVGVEQGVDGELAPKEVVYYAATIPAGKYSVSVGIDAKNGTAFCTADILDERGVPFYTAASQNKFFVNPSGGEQRREEVIVKYLKPKNVIIRLESDLISAGPFPYNLSITKEE